MKLKKTIMIIVLLCFPFASIANAHPGRTDQNGGHTCRTNCEKWGLKYGEYHYHNGGNNSSRSSSSSGSSANAASSSISPKENVPEGSVKVSLPGFNIFVNGQQISNSTSKYPVVVYKDITYFPMTWNYTQALALETKWDAEVGFVIRKTNNKPANLNTDPGVPASKLYATMPEFNVYVNDVWIDNSSEEYPLLVLNDITYFPMTWKFAVEELGLTTKFENNSFYISK
ncbi:MULTISPECIES: YHYH domain-containing protein [unclassified Paenibacillus]|uniref:YHYH domain-containing protein n=1 Tax=unclassified Paenibacillus TaxID=185978 RepID=UPI0006CF683F|nr:MULTISPECIES: YHYH domain-containing protein [unclassified Paenibacillus]